MVVTFKYYLLCITFKGLIPIVTIKIIIVVNLYLNNSIGSVPSIPTLMPRAIAS